MFLHSGASLHGHEFSARRSSTAQIPLPTRHPLLRTALRPLAPPELNAAAQTHASEGVAHRRRSLDSSRPSSLSSRNRPASGSFTKKDLAVRFREPDMDQAHTPLASEDEESVAGSELSDCTDISIRRTKRKRAPRKSTRFALAHPAPQLRTKQRMLVQLRPRLLLQLQEVGDRRAIPAFDVIPSSLVAGTIIIPRLAKRFPRMVGARPELGQNDVLVVRSDDYGPSTPGSTPVTDNGGDSLDDRDVVAVISALPQQSSSCAEIVLEDGATWVASLMANGSYEFTHIDDQGRTTTARWVRRSLASTRNSAVSVGPSHTPTSSQPAEYKWTFSFIDPSSRRHPIMGSLTSDSVEIYDTYNSLSPSSRRYPPSRSFVSDVNGGHREPVSPAAPRKEERATHAVTQGQKKVMIATATWISLHQQGWPASANPKFARTVSSHCRSASSGASARRQTLPAYDGDGSRAASPLNSSLHTPDSSVDPPAVSNPQSIVVPARAMSTGRAFMRRRSSRRESGATPDRRLSGISQHSTQSHTREQEEKTHTCRPRFRQWLHKLFHRKKCPDQEGELLKYKLEE